MTTPSPVPPTTDPRAAWWARHRLWLIGALLLGAWAFAAPYRDARQQYDANHPQDFVTVGRGESGELAGASWRLVSATRLAALPADAGKPLRADSVMLVVRFEVTAGSETDIDALDSCQGELIDADDREWDANPLTVTGYRSADRIGRMCGSRMGENLKRVSAQVGQPFVFQQLYQIPASLPTDGLHAEIRMPSRRPDPAQPALRFAL